MNSSLRSISKAMSHVLRHEPEKYGIELDKEGWADVHELVKAIGSYSFDNGAIG